MAATSDQRAMMKRLKQNGFSYVEGTGRQMLVSHPEMRGRVIVAWDGGPHGMRNAMAELRRRRGDPSLFR